MAMDLSPMQIAKTSLSHFHSRIPTIRPCPQRGSLCKSFSIHVPQDVDIDINDADQTDPGSMVKRARKAQVQNAGQPSAVGAPNKKFKVSPAFPMPSFSDAFGGVRTGGYPRAAPIPGALGHQRMADWDFLWSPARLAIVAATSMKHGQLEALGEKTAFRIVPRTFTLPDELPAWKLWLSQQQARQGEEGSSGEGASTKEYPLWILKTAQHLGKGLRLLPPDDALIDAVKKRAPPLKPYVAVQEYVDDPMLINNCKFGVRVWVLVTGFNPLRIYMHTGGLVLFSTDSYDNDNCVTADGSMGLGHVTNYALNMDGAVWSLDQLKDHMGEDAYSTLWKRISKSTADVFSAALKPMKTNHKLLKIPPGGTFESFIKPVWLAPPVVSANVYGLAPQDSYHQRGMVGSPSSYHQTVIVGPQVRIINVLLGLDYLVDSSLHPWLLEVNGTPSLAVDHNDPVVEQMIFDQKNGMVKDMVNLLDCKSRFTPRYTAMKMFPQGLDAAISAPPPTPESVRAAAAGEAANELQMENDEEGGSKSGKKNAPTPVTTVEEHEKGQRMAKRLKEQLNPTTDAGVMLRVKQELMNLGGFEPIMPLLPLGTMRSEKSINLSRIPWDPRDYALREIMKVMESETQAKGINLSCVPWDYTLREIMKVMESETQ
eukprot:gene21519-28505_t